jgi:[CysO sulfur-carrier protein]-S-L-cysteine hydrolase
MPEITLSVTKNQMDSLIRLTKEDLPNESCCLLLGRIVNDNEYCVELVKIMENKTRSEYSFQMDPDELKEAYQWASNNSLDVVGVYHSHLDGSTPSSTDLIFMKLNPVIWLIYEVSGSRFRAFTVVKDILKEVKIKISRE